MFLARENGNFISQRNNGKDITFRPMNEFLLTQTLPPNAFPTLQNTAANEKDLQNIHRYQRQLGLMSKKHLEKSRNTNWQFLYKFTTKAALDIFSISMKFTTNAEDQLNV